MKADNRTLDIVLLGREYRVACPPGEKEELLASAAYLDGRMRELAERTRASGERLAVMAALNIAHEFLQMKAASGIDLEAVRKRLGDMAARVDAVLAQQEQLF